jgi:predicted nucleotidyltransferase component of viral defense system
LTRLRKLVAFDRFLARLETYDPDIWVLKGGYALQLRLGEKARTTKDIDLLMQHAAEQAHELLSSASMIDLGDWFSFDVERAVRIEQRDEPLSSRYPVHSLLDGRTFEKFHVDVGVGDPLVRKPERLAAPPMLEFAGIQPTSFPSYPVAQHLAEKIHALTRTYGTSGSTRIRDLIDILLIAMMFELNSEELMRALRLTFEARATHEMPTHLPNPPPEWARMYLRQRRELELPWKNLEDAFIAIRSFIEPTLQETAFGNWSHEAWKWL